MHAMTKAIRKEMISLGQCLYSKANFVVFNFNLILKPFKTFGISFDFRPVKMFFASNEMFSNTARDP